MLLPCRTTRTAWDTPGPRRPGHRAFTVIELLVVIGVIAALGSMLLPALGKARLAARVSRAHGELRQMTLAIEMYHDRFHLFPPARTNCMTDDFYPMPHELLDYDCTDQLPDDVFDPGDTYRYHAPGWGFVNESPRNYKIYVPQGFPSDWGIDVYHDQDSSPVKCAVWSVGPSGPKDKGDVLALHYPVPPRNWYPTEPDGIIVHYYWKECWHSSP